MVVSSLWSLSFSPCVPHALPLLSYGVRPNAPQEGFSLTAPLVFYYGHTSLQENPELFKKLVVSERRKSLA